MERPFPKRPLRASAVICFDIALAAAALLLFALFHHVLPKTGERISPIVSFTPRPSQTAGATPAPRQDNPLAAAPKPTPEPETGDFSNSFPTEDTGENALYSYQSDDLRVAVRLVEENGAAYYVADVYVRYIELFRTAFAKDQYGGGIHESTKKLAGRMNAVVAVNGDYYGARSKGIVIRNGDLYRDSLFEDVCVVYADGVMETYPKEEFDIALAIERGAWQAWSFGPRLMENGVARTAIKSAIGKANPRCAIGYYAPGHYCLVVVDGRQDGYSVGMSLDELAALFESLGCTQAYNMDGGATAQMAFKGERVNRPAGGGRDCSDIIYFTDGE